MTDLYEDRDLRGPLQNRIRLVRVLDVDSDPVELSMCMSSLVTARRMPFQALSYTWRSPLMRNNEDTSETDPTYTITCRSPSGARYELKIFRNLYDALCQIGVSDHRDDWFWIDYFCINQHDNAELSVQVQKMAYIYDQADGAIFWLGRTDEYLDRAEMLIRKLCSQGPDHLRWQKINPKDLNKAFAKQMLGEECCKVQCWQALARFFNRTWFSRAWVVQEVLLSQKLSRQPIVLCGDKEFSWSDLTNVSGYLAKSLWKGQFANSQFLGLRKEDRHKMVTSHHGPAKLAAAQRDLAQGSMDTFLHFLIRIREYDCSKPEDKVYSLYSIAKRHMALDPDIRLPEVDYTKSVRDIYIDATEVAWKTSDELHFLAHAESVHSPEHDLPSWVPDWSRSDKIGLAITGYRRYDAGGVLEQLPQYSVNRTVLTIQAAWLDTISDIGEVKSDSRNNFPLCLDLLCSLLEPKLGESEHLFEAFWRTLIRDTDESGDCPAGGHWQLDDSFCAWVIKIAIDNGNGDGVACLFDALVKIHEDSRPDLRENLMTMASGNHSLFKFLMQGPQTDSSSFDLAFSYRENLRVFRTTAGYLGLGTASLRKGDTVWIVPGSRVPLIMEKPSDEKRYRLVGGAYVHGVMKGEALGGALNWTMIEIQ